MVRIPTVFPLIFAAFWVWSVCAWGESLQLDTLSSLVVPGEMVSGRFVQCNVTRSSAVRSTGKFTFSPRKYLLLETESPVRQSSKLFSDGSKRTTLAGVEAKSEDRSAVNAVILSILGLEQDQITQHFDIELKGDLSEYHLALTPLVRLSGMFRGISIDGSEQGPDRIEVELKGDRKLITHLLLDAQVSPEEIRCP